MRPQASAGGRFKRLKHAHRAARINLCPFFRGRQKGRDVIALPLFARIDVQLLTMQVSQVIKKGHARATAAAVVQRVIQPQCPGTASMALTG